MVNAGALCALTPPEEMLTGPVVALLGTLAITSVEESTLNVDAATPLNFTPLTADKLEPTM